MKTTRSWCWWRWMTIFMGGFGAACMTHAQQLDSIGVTLLRDVATNADGAGIRVAQPEAGYPTFEVNPTNSAVQEPVGLFTYWGSNGTATVFPNSLGTESGHADEVAANFYGLPGGVATNVAHVDNFEANYFYTGVIAATVPQNINDPVVNQSFIFGYVPTEVTVSQQQQIDSQFDDYATEYGTLFVSGAGNGGPASGTVAPPSTCYNGISVGAYGYANSSVGPTQDNGRAKPDITAPAGATSFSTPQVSGAAAVLMQMGRRGQGGGDTNAATDLRTIKALLLNGAVKPMDWTNNPPSPLDPRYGAGILNVFNSYEQLAGGEHAYIANTTESTGSPHPPTGAAGTVDAASGWDFDTVSSSVNADSVNHYYFNVTNGMVGAPFSVTATLVWNRHLNQTAINNLDLFLYEAESSNLVAASTSVVDNVEHIWLPKLPQGRYDLQVLKHGGMNTVSSSETYALAFEFFSTILIATQTDTNLVLSWPVYPDGFVLQSTASLNPPIVWSTVNVTPTVTNRENRVTLNPAATAQFFRLHQP